MNTKGYGNIPSELYHYITFLAQVLPKRSTKTFIELLIGCLLTQSGFVTSAWWILDMKNKWFSYHKWLEKGKWSYLVIMKRWVVLLLQQFTDNTVYLAIDDSIVLRHSKKAPESKIHHQHGSKTNLSQFVRGQCWVALAAVVDRAGCNTALPILFRLTPEAGNSSKLTTARTLVRAVIQQFKERAVTILVDSWYMRGSFILPIQNYQVNVIGQVRIDTVLCQKPEPYQGRGRPRKFGQKYTKGEIEKLPLQTKILRLYGREQKVHFRSATAKARFLKGQLVRFVWCEFEDDKGLRKPRLLVSTNTEISGLEIIRAYEKRWCIEPMFNQLKNAWGMKQAWQQTRMVLHRWVHLITLGYILPQLLAIKCSNNLGDLLDNAPWQKSKPTTAGRIRLGLVKYFSHVRVRDWWDVKSLKFQPPNLDILKQFEELG